MSALRRRSLRLQNRDYRFGTYFVTINTWDRAPLLGEVTGAQMQLSAAGMIAQECWLALGGYSQVALDSFVIMSNHVHGVLVLGKRRPDGQHAEPAAKPLGALIGAFKTASTNRIHAAGVAEGLPIWHRNYYEHVVRESGGLERIRRYIANNPANWHDHDAEPALP
jgi:putative transposase